MASDAFLIDIGFTLTRSKATNPFGDNARTHLVLICQCGQPSSFFKSVQREVLHLEQEKLYTDDKGLRNLQCESCGKNYPEVMRLQVLEPNKGKIIQINYTTERHLNQDGTITHLLKKERVYAIYNIDFKLESVFDTIEFNEQTKKAVVSFDNKKYPDENYFINVIKVDVVDAGKTKSVRDELDIDNLDSLNKFFGFLNNVQYSGLPTMFSYLINLDYLIVDIHKIKKIPTISELYDSHEVITETVINPQTKEREVKMFRLIDDGFGEKEKSSFIVGEYLESIKEMARLFFSIISFENITTLLLTKGYIFYDSFLRAPFVCHSAVYEQHLATNPNKILEISTNHMHCGVPRIVLQSLKGQRITPDLYLKISDTLNNAIRIPSDMEKLLQIFQLKILTKTELELVFQKYPINDVYVAIGFFTKTINHKNINLTFRIFEHALKYKLWDGYISNRFWEDFLDTLNTIQQIIESKEKVKDFLLAHWKKLSRDERSSYHEYLSIKENIIYEARTPAKLKKLHDDISILHAIFQDAKKAALYADAIQGWPEKLNQEINDVSFSVIHSAKEMFVEHTIMSHCIQTYVDRVIEKIFIPVRVRDNVSKEKATLGITLNKDEMSFGQLKGYDNSRATKFLIDTVLEFCKKNEIKLENSNLISVDLQSDSSKEIKMPDYLTDNEVTRIRKKKLDNKITKKNSPLTDLNIKSIIENFKRETSNK